MQLEAWLACIAALATKLAVHFIEREGDAQHRSDALLAKPLTIGGGHRSHQCLMGGRFFDTTRKQANAFRLRIGNQDGKVSGIGRPRESSAAAFSTIVATIERHPVVAGE